MKMTALDTTDQPRRIPYLQWALMEIADIMYK